MPANILQFDGIPTQRRLHFMGSVRTNISKLAGRDSHELVPRIRAIKEHCVAAPGCENFWVGCLKPPRRNAQPSTLRSQGIERASTLSKPNHIPSLACPSTDLYCP